MSPSDLPWWGWFLCAGGAAFVARLFFAAAWSDLLVAQSVQRSQRAYVLGCVASVAAAILGLIGLVRFIKWIWES
jgi:hypothetical protein